MIEIEEYDSHPSIVTPDMRLHFIQTLDQWNHRFDVACAWGKCIAISERGTTDRVGPDRVVNPTFQQLHFQREVRNREEVIQALLVGQAGPYYFSAVFTVSEDDKGTTIGIEIAGRNRGPAAVFASTYRMLVPATDAVDADSQQVVWRMDGWGTRFTRFKFAAQAHPVFRTAVTLIEGDHDVLVRAGAKNIGDATQQWRYLWRFWS